MRWLHLGLVAVLLIAAMSWATPAEAAPPGHSPAQGTIIHVVQRGETLSGIAARYGVTVSAIVAANRLTNPSRIYVGQRLVIPQRSGETAPSQSAPYPGECRVGVSGKRIVIDLSQQRLYAYQDSRLVYSFVCSSGRAPYYTRTGEFRVQSKIPRAWGSAWGFWMPHWLGIYWAGSTENGIHALPVWPNGHTLWAGYLGRPISFGCIVLGAYDAQLLYNWAAIGTPVSIRN